MPRARLTEYLTSLVCDGLPDLSSLGSAGTWLPAPSDAPSEQPTDAPSQPTDSVANVLPIAAADARRSS